MGDKKKSKKAGAVVDKPAAKPVGEPPQGKPAPPGIGAGVRIEPAAMLSPGNESPLFVQIDYEAGNSVLLESVGPNSALGFVADAVFGHFSEAPSGQKLKAIRVGFSGTFAKES